MASSSRDRTRGMADYRIYCLTSDGRINLADWIIAASDEEAIAAARKTYSDAKRCEIWLKDRFVARLSDSGHFERADA